MNLKSAENSAFVTYIELSEKIFLLAILELFAKFKGIGAKKHFQQKTNSLPVSINLN